jgi:hypothetical protein
MLSRIAASLNLNRIVLALSVARLGDAMGNSILYIVIPLYVAALAAPILPAPEPIRVAILISLYGLVNSAIQPMMGSLSVPAALSSGWSFVTPRGMDCLPLRP